MDSLESIIENKEFKNSYVEAIFNSANNILYVIDSSNNILLVNNAFMDFFTQYESLEEFKQNHKSVCEFFQGDDQFNYVLCEMNGQPWYEYVLEYSFLNQYARIINNNKEYIFNVKVSQIDYTTSSDTDTKKHYIVTLTDFTQFLAYERKLEAQVKEKAAMIEEQYERIAETEKFASLGALVAGVAHEINTPVGVALTASSFLQGEARNLKKAYENDDLDEEDFENFIENIQEVNDSILINLQKAANLINSFKQVSVDQSSDEIRVINLRRYVHEILLSLHSKIKTTGHKVKINVDKSINMNTNPGAISQILTNFITNSLIHGFKDRSKGLMTISGRQDDYGLTLKYKDNGVGLSDEVKKKIYDPFFTTNRDSGGSGLGMNIVYNLVTAKLGGTIEINSEVEDGVEFIMRLRV